ncbi:MAG: hypothetical protein LBP21_05200 [Synergistaceae bacterium]|jgi:hypothetical protein|nr:hypothetical protein [Synergistaceae bacterium]
MILTTPNIDTAKGEGIRKAGNTRLLKTEDGSTAVDTGIVGTLRTRRKARAEILVAMSSNPLSNPAAVTKGWIFLAAANPLSSLRGGGPALGILRKMFLLPILHLPMLHLLILLLPMPLRLRADTRGAAVILRRMRGGKRRGIMPPATTAGIRSLKETGANTRGTGSTRRKMSSEGMFRPDLLRQQDMGSPRPMAAANIHAEPENTGATRGAVTFRHLLENMAAGSTEDMAIPKAAAIPGEDGDIQGRDILTCPTSIFRKDTRTFSKNI